MLNARLGMILMITAGIFAGMSNVSFAQYTGPGGPSKSSPDSGPVDAAFGQYETGQKMVTVKDLKRNPVYDEEVVLRGRIIKRTGENAYRFKDETGNMMMLIDDRLFASKPVSDKTKVEVVGVMTDKHNPKDYTFNVIRMSVLK